ncbi:MAG: alanine racemase [Fidelibacterota bacterium]|nr:MAG: alanine racemase [Candidatus Neomarinimicrobiota bacterium]
MSSRKTGEKAIFVPRADIYLGRLKANFLGLSGQVGNAKVLAVVKADGYGHGLVPVSKALAEAGVFGFGVAVLQEGLALRKAGLQPMILHMGRFNPLSLDTYLQENIRLSLHSLDDIQALVAHHKTTGSEYIAHLKIDTGMTRLGIPYESAVEALEELKRHPFIHLEGIWTHLATADEADQSYLRYQLVRFTQFVHMVRKLHIDVEFFHAANSSALVQDETSHFNMVRPGLLLYGVRPSEHVKPDFEVLPVMDLKAPLVKVQAIKRGIPVGYGKTYNATEDTTTGLLQIGYADGIPVALSNKGLVLIGDSTYPIIGRVSMDLCNIDLGEDVHAIGTEALVWGLADDDRLRVEHQARLAGTIPYELLVRVGSRVERNYVED